MSEPLRDALVALGLPPGSCRTRPVGGGDIHDAVRVEPPDGAQLFVKSNRRPLPGIFEKEARGLDALRAACVADGGLIRVPGVLAVGARFLALEWIPQGGRATRGEGDVGARLGRGLAALHRHTASHFGWSEDNWIGSLPQSNGRVAAEAGCGAFFAAERLRAQARIGGDRLPPGLRTRLDLLCDRIDRLLPLGEEAPALLHGDLWGGNWIAGDAGEPWLFDPAVHYGCREAELAFTRMFGGFPASFYGAYEEAFPLAPGFDARVDIWNLYPLLVHANLFGGGYAGSADRLLRRLTG